MAEYIDREVLIRILRAKAEMGRLSGFGVYFDNAAKMVELLPAADVAPVKNGKWVNYAGKHDRGMDLRCSICNLRASYFVGGSDEWWDNSRPNYCPNCGAKMEGE